jgi:hypothetical protein
MVVDGENNHLSSNAWKIHAMEKKSPVCVHPGITSLSRSTLRCQWGSVLDATV